MPEKVLVIDDDEHVCEMVRIALEAEGLTVDEAYDGNEGLKKVLSGDYAVLLLDIMLPETDGWDICRQIRNSNLRGLPIIMLTARGDEIDRVLGLELGADDYVTKPFSPREMAARVKALIRRSDSYNLNRNQLGYGDLHIDLNNLAVRIGKKSIKLTPKEMALLNLLARQPGNPLTRDELLKEVWGFDPSTAMTRTLDEHVKRLRAKIARLDPHTEYIQTVWGVGYKFEVKRSD
ncbi:MAG: response regulator transcription factor [Bacillota bacterium]